MESPLILQLVIFSHLFHILSVITSKEEDTIPGVDQRELGLSRWHFSQISDLAALQNLAKVRRELELEATASQVSTAFKVAETNMSWESKVELVGL